MVGKRNMRLKRAREIASFFFVIFFITGCCQSQDNVVETASLTETSVYFKHGIGLDFGMDPISEKKTSVSGYSNSSVIYELAGHAMLDVDQRITLLMSQLGCERFVRSSTKNSLSVLYKNNDGVVVALRYRQVVVDGLKRKTFLTLTWRN